MRPTILTLLSLFLSFSGSAAVAQTEQPAVTLTTTQVLNDWVTNIEGQLVPAADAMPEEKYSFKPTQGKFAGIRTFAEQVKHLAAANYQLGSRMLGEDPPPGTKGESAPDSVHTKAEILAYLKGSFACLHRAAGMVSESNQVEPIPNTKGTWQRTRLGLLIDALAHSSNHYGQMVEYLRMNGIVPPQSR